MSDDTIKRLRGELLLTYGRDRAEFRWIDVGRLVDTAEALQVLIADVENKWGDPHTLRHARAALDRLAGSPTK